MKSRMVMLVDCWLVQLVQLVSQWLGICVNTAYYYEGPAREKKK